MQKQINMKKCTTKREMNKQVFFMIWRSVWSKTGHYETTHASKKGIFEKFFFLIQSEGEIVVQRKLKVKLQEKMSSRRRRSRKQMTKQKRIRK